MASRRAKFQRNRRPKNSHSLSLTHSLTHSLSLHDFKLESDFFPHFLSKIRNNENCENLFIGNYNWAKFQRKKKTFLDHSSSLGIPGSWAEKKNLMGARWAHRPWFFFENNGRKNKKKNNGRTMGAPPKLWFWPLFFFPKKLNGCNKLWISTKIKEI